MKNIAVISLALITTCISTFATSADLPINSKSWENLFQKLKVVNICSLTNDDLDEITKGHHPETIVEFSAQTILPISFFLKGDLVSLVENKGKIGEVEIKQTFYARYVEELIFSTNLIDWKPFFEFITGTASIELTVQDGKPSIVFGSEANRRL